MCLNGWRTSEVFLVKSSDANVLQTKEVIWLKGEVTWHSKKKKKKSKHD